MLEKTADSNVRTARCFVAWMGHTAWNCAAWMLRLLDWLAWSATNIIAGMLGMGMIATALCNVLTGPR
jgi:hypothetical protein